MNKNLLQLSIVNIFLYQIFILKQYMAQRQVLIILAAILYVTCSLKSHRNGFDLQNYSNSLIYGTMCSKFKSRDLVDDQAQADSAANRDAMQMFFSQSGNQLIVSVIQSDNATQASMDILPEIAVGLGLFIGPFVVGLVFSLFLWPFLCCCIGCSCCCINQKDRKKLTQCQLYWPSIVLILSLLLLVGASVFGIFRAADIQNSYQAVGCSIGISYNDVLMGNTSTTGKYFSGIPNIVSGFNVLQQNIDQVDTLLQGLEFSNSSGVLKPAYDQGTNLLNTLSQVPNGTIGGTMQNFSYNHFDGSGTPNDVPSLFPMYLGTAFGPNASGAMNISYFVINQINQGLRIIAENALQFTSQIDTVNDTINSLSNSMQQLSTQMYQSDNDNSHIVDAATPYMSVLTLVVTIFFAICIGLGVISILGTASMTFCKMYSCRYTVYLICVMLGVLAIFCFLVAVVFSIVTPAVYFSCDYLKVTVSSPQNFQRNLNKVIDPQMISYAKVCLKGQSGDIINQIPDLDLSAINGLTTAINEMRAYNNISQVQNTVNTTLYQLSQFIDSYYYTQQFDFNSDSDKQIMRKIANPANYIDCRNNGFQMDSWVPSLKQNQISCYGTTTNATDVQCPNSTAIIQGRSGSNDTVGCFGCMDTTRILLRSTDPISDIMARYGTDGSCGTWANEMGSLWMNYYDIKNRTIYPVKARMLTTIDTYMTPTTGYQDRLSQVGQQISLVTQRLQQIVSTVFDPNRGMIAGLNCLLLGQDLTLIVQTTCTHVFNTLYFLRLTLGLCAFAILFSLCCATCSSMRAYKMSVIERAIRRNELRQMDQFGQYSRTALMKDQR